MIVLCVNRFATDYERGIKTWTLEDVFKIDISTVYKWIKENKKNHLEIYKNHSITSEIITYIKIDQTEELNMFENMFEKVFK